MNPKVNDNMFDHQKECDLVNIPVQRWIHIVITLNNKRPLAWPFLYLVDKFFTFQ